MEKISNKNNSLNKMGNIVDVKMIKIIKIIDHNKSVILKLSNGEILSIYRQVFDEQNLNQNCVIDVEKIKEINSYYKCLNYALKLIKNRDYSYLKLEDKLKEKFKKSTVISVVKHLKDFMYIDEETSINNIIHKCIENNDGPIKIKAKLIKKGYNIDNIDFNKYKYNLEICALKFINNNKEEDKLKKEQKLYRYLLIKGYNRSDVNSYVLGRRNIKDD